MAITVSPISDLVVKDAPSTTIDLFNHFDDPRTTGLVARFELYNTALAGGVTNVLLFDQAGAGAPLTVQNFRKYVTDGDYTNTVIHRSVPGFVVQGGGFTVNNLSTVLAQTPNSGAAAVTVIPTDPPVQNEFSAGRSNLRGTIAMAKVGGNPNSATNQWFFNLANNAANLDTQNGGFTAFGQVLGASDLAVLDAIATVPRYNGTTFFGQSAFTDLPLILANPNAPQVTGDENLIRYRSITVSQLSELQFAVVGNTNPGLVNPTVNNGQLSLNYTPNKTGFASITLRATNLVGETVDDSFLVGVAGSIATPGADFLQGTDSNNSIRGLAGNDWILGLGGSDRLVGQGGADTLAGGAGRDLFQGGAGNDVMDGGIGNDVMDGDAGKDLITTGSGRDVILIGLREGTDVVTDFTDRRDRIDLTGTLTFQQLTVRQQGTDTLLKVGSKNLMLLEDVSAKLITRADFI